jgi:hypothetical protein
MSEIAKRTDLTEEEGAPGLRGDPTIEVNGSAYVPGMGFEFLVKASSMPRETLGKPLAVLMLAVASFILVAAGWGSAEVLKSIGTPGWAQLAGMVAPTVVGFALIVLLRLHRRQRIILVRPRARRGRAKRTIPGSVIRR